MQRILLVLLLSLSNIACHPPATIVTQQGKTAYTADQVAVRVNELENTAIQAQANNALKLNDTRTIVRFCVSADTILKTAPSGWQTTLLTSWIETKKSLPTFTNPAIIAAMNAVDIVLGVVQQ